MPQFARKLMCSCATLTTAIYVEDQPPTLLTSLDLIASGNWIRLCRCRNCGQLWRVDEADKYQTQFAFKLSNVAGWEAFDTKPVEIELLVKSRGGLSNQQCGKLGCDKRAVHGAAFCPDHLYETGTRR
jgi:hypothetical protein